MSEYRVVKTEFRDRECLKKALDDVAKELGIRYAQGENLTLYGYMGDARPETAEFVIRRRYLDTLSNDLGYRWNPEKGIFEEIVSEYDQRVRRVTMIRNKVRQRYAYHKVLQEARRKGMAVQAVEQKGGVIHITLRALR